MTQFTLPVIDPGVNTGTELSNWLNQWRPALESAHQGASRPSYAVPGMIWVNNANPSEWIVNVYDGTHDVPVLKFDPATGIPDAPGGDVVGPGTSVAGNAAIFADATGKLLGQKAVQSNTTDTTAAALMINGAWGLGASQCPDLPDLDDLTVRTGFWRATASTLGTKPESANGVVVIINYSSGAEVIVRQFFLRASSSSFSNSGVYVRMGTTTLGWGAWNEVPLADFYGVGSVSPPTVTDLNNASLKCGIYRADAATLNKPTSLSGIVFILPFTGTTYGRQLFLEASNTADAIGIYARSFRAGTTWGAWQPVYTDSGALTPTLVNSFLNHDTFRYRRIGKVAMVFGGLGRNTPFSTLTNITTLPAGYRPAGPIGASYMVFFDNLATQLVNFVLDETGSLATTAGITTGGSPSGHCATYLSLTYPVA